MEPQHIRFGGGAAESLVHPLVGLWMLTAITLILRLPRDKAIVPFLLAFFTIPFGQVLVLAGVHLTMLRILILTVVARRAAFRRSSSVAKFPGGFNKVDCAVVLWTISALVVVSLQWMDSQALVKFLGDFLDAFGGYLAVRFLIVDREGISRVIKVFAALCVIQGVVMINEQRTGLDMFGYLGGMGGVTSAVVDGHIRAGGVMGCLYAAAFGAVWMPLFLWLWVQGKDRMIAFAGIAGGTAMAITSHSSTGILALGGGVLGLCFWPLRRQMRLCRYGLVAILVGLHLVMNGPVWSIIEHIDLTGSSSSYHRYQLIDTLIKHFGEWWLLGTRDNGNWGWEMWDTCNQFVAIAVTGGLLTLAFYLLVLKRSFAAVGNARRHVSGDREQEWFLWCLGSSLLAHVVGQFGINYMAQLLLVLFPLLACISVAANARLDTTQKAEMLHDSQLASTLHGNEFGAKFHTFGLYVS
jgi:hypothetical protein